MTLWDADDKEKEDFERDVKEIIYRHGGNITEMEWIYDDERDELNYHICLDDLPKQHMITDLKRHCDDMLGDNYACRWDDVTKDKYGFCP